MKMIPEVKTEGVPPWLATFLRGLRGVLLQRIYGQGDRLGKAVTFKDLVDMGLASENEATEQAAKNE